MKKKGMVIGLFLLCLFGFTPNVQANEAIDFEMLFEEHQSVMLIIHPETGEIYYANQAAIDFYGYGQTLIGMNINVINVLSDDDIARERQNALEEDRNFFVFEHRLASGDVRDVHVYSNPVDINGDTYLYSLVIDQTTFIAAQAQNRVLVISVFVLLGLLLTSAGVLLFNVWREKESLKASQAEENHLHKLLDYIVSNSTQAIAIHDRQLNYLYVSDEYFEQYGLEDRNIIGKHHYEVFPDLPQKWREVHQRALNGEEVRENRDTYPREDGSTDYTRWVCKPWYDKDGNIGGIVLYSEVINDLIDTEIELKRSKEQLERVMAYSPVGMAVHSFTPTVKFEYMNDNFLRIFDTTKAVLNQSNTFWRLFNHPNNRETSFKDDVLERLKKTNPARLSWENVSIMTKSGTTRYINVYSTPLPDSELFVTTVIDVTERKQKEDEIAHVSLHDYLTEIPNRRYYQKKLLRYDQPQYYPLGIINMDVNGLKLINDAFGHESGNEALQIIAKIIAKNIGHDDFVARIGGDEFAILCPNTNEDTIAALLDRIHEAVNRQMIRDITLSIASGYAFKYDNKQSIRSVITTAEDDMYKHKVISGNTDRNQAIQSILQTLQNKYNDEKIHSQRVSRFSRLIGEALNLKHDDIKELEMAALYHDIGKITIPDDILKKPGKLTASEWEIMKKHTLSGYQILRAADQYSNIAEYAMSHHERIDGKGYPNGIKGEAIPLFSRIISVCDAYEAMTSPRPYSAPLKP